jgi:hypothetical protein
MKPTPSTDPAPFPDPTYNRDAIFDEHGPFRPAFIDEAVRTLMRTLPLDPAEPQAWAYRRMHSAMTALAALHPRDEVEVMLGVQALSAYHAASACWYVGMNASRPNGALNGDNTRHITTAASAARAFDAMLRALERRQAKPLFVPIGRPASQTWPRSNATAAVLKMEQRCRAAPEPPAPTPTEPLATEPPIIWTSEDLRIAEASLERQRMEQENAGLDIANTEGILPGGGIIMMENPTPQQEAYIGRRLGLMYKREHAENQRNGIKEYPKIRGIRPGDLIP